MYLYIIHIHIHLPIRIHIHIHIYIYLYNYIYVCMKFDDLPMNNGDFPVRDVKLPVREVEKDDVLKLAEMESEFQPIFERDDENAGRFSVQIRESVEDIDDTS